MNFSFMIDNCLSSCQPTYNGLTILDYAKNATEYFVKKRLKMSDTKYDTYHLFSSNKPLSTWAHDIYHFLQTLKTVQPTLDSYITLDECFHNLNKFRALNGADNLFGGRDIQKIESGIVFLFTNREVPIQSAKLALRWDYRLIVFYLQPPGLEECVWTAKETTWDAIAAEVGCGLCYKIFDYKELFRILDELQVQPQVCLRLHLGDAKLFEAQNYDEYARHLERTKLEETPKTWLVRSPQKLNGPFYSQRLRPQPNMTIFTKVYLPEQYPLQDLTVTFLFILPTYPEYYIDFSTNIQASLPSFLSTQPVPIENNDLLAFAQQISKRKGIDQYPVFYLEREKRDEAKPPIVTLMMMVGTLVFSGQQLELRFYFPNFFAFLDSFVTLQNPQANRKNAELKFLSYLQSVPNYYAPCIKKMLQDSKIMLQRPLQFMQDEESHQAYLTKIKQQQGKLQKYKKQIDEENQKNRYNHNQKKSNCCAVFSDNYEQKFAEQLNTEFRQYTKRKPLYNFRSLLPPQVCQPCLPQMPNSGWPPFRNSKVEPEEPEQRLEAAFCGNPWRLFRKTYKDGVEIRVRSESEDEQVEDMMLTKVESLKKTNSRNRRKGFMRLKDIRDCNHRQVAEEKVTEDQIAMEIEENTPCKSADKFDTVRLRFEPIFQVTVINNKAKFKLEVIQKLSQ